MPVNDSLAADDQEPIYDWARAALERTKSQLPDDKLALYVDSTVRTLLLRYPCLVSYSALIEDDKAFFQEAAGLMVALRFRPKMRKALPTGDLTQVKLQAKAFRWAEPGKAGKPLEQQWLDEALTALGRIGCIAHGYRQTASSFSIFTVSGPTRSSIDSGFHESLLSGVIRLITDDWNSDIDSQDMV